MAERDGEEGRGGRKRARRAEGVSRGGAKKVGTRWREVGESMVGRVGGDIWGGRAGDWGVVMRLSAVAPAPRSWARQIAQCQQQSEALFHLSLRCLVSAWWEQGIWL